MANLPSTAPTPFDGIFAGAVKGTTIPVAYLQSLAKQESNLNPAAIGPGKERGLLQVHPQELRAYNLVHTSTITADQSADPATNAHIAVWILSRKMKSFADHHPVSLKEDWKDRRYVGLLTQAYNAGEEETNGVGKLIDRMEKQGLPPEKMTYLSVAQLNLMTKDNPYLSQTNRQAYVGRVVDGYFARLAPGILTAGGSASSFPDGPGSSEPGPLSHSSISSDTSADPTVTAMSEIQAAMRDFEMSIDAVDAALQAARVDLQGVFNALAMVKGGK